MMRRARVSLFIGVTVEVLEEHLTTFLSMPY
jgi:hypothetical protein